MKKGHGKTGYKAKNGKFLMTMSAIVKRIASLIRKWLEQDEKERRIKVIVSRRKQRHSQKITIKFAILLDLGNIIECST